VNSVDYHPLSLHDVQGHTLAREMSYNPRKRQRLSPDPKDHPFVFFGTPLPPLDPEIRDDGTFVPLWKQEVPDFRKQNN
jgi:hypothetical protein